MPVNSRLIAAVVADTTVVRVARAASRSASASVYGRSTGPTWTATAAAATAATAPIDGHTHSEVSSSEPGSGQRAKAMRGFLRGIDTEVPREDDRV